MVSDKFRAWVKTVGVQPLAEWCGVHRSTIYAWLSGEIVPTDEHRLLILKLAGRKLKLGDIVQGY